MSSQALPFGAALLTIGGLAALKAKQRANQFNDYERLVNMSLPEGYKVPEEHKSFLWGKGSLDYKRDALNMLAKSRLSQYANDTELGDYNNQATRFGMAPFRSTEAAKAILGPYGSQDAQFIVPSQYGPQYLKGRQFLHENFDEDGGQRQGSPILPPFVPPGKTVNTPGGTVQFDISESSPPILSTGVTQRELPPLPEGAMLTPGMIDSYYKERPAYQNARTNERKQKLAEDEYTNIKTPKARLEMKRIEVQIKNIQQIMKYRPQEAKARIAALASKSGRSPSSIEMMLAAGKTPKEIGKMLFQKASANLLPEEEDYPSTGAPAPVEPQSRDYNGHKVVF